ncbi:unnamed protein product [Caenorhabditis brenneri]
MSFLFWPPAAYVLSSVSSFPHAVSGVVCMQLDVPYQEGAITISSTFVYGNNSMNYAHLIFSSMVMIAIISTTGLMMAKLRKRKLIILIPTLPFIYIVPTMVVMWKVFKGYRAEPSKDAKLTLDGHLFSLLMLYFIANIIFFFADLLRFNIPASGLITSWCASLSPNKLFVLLIMIVNFSTMSEAVPANDSIHGLQAYKSFVPVFNFTTFQAFLPYFYIIPTMVVMVTILIKYQKAKAASNSATMDHNIFAFIMFYFLFNMMFYFGDYFHLNLPTTGFMTSWCAGTEPNRLFSALLVYAYYSNFGVIICPFLVCVMRLTIMLSPRHNERLDHPFSFGSIIIYEGEEYAKLNIYIHFTFSVCIFSSNAAMTTFMFYKLRMTQSSTTSARTKELTRKAEFSLFLAVVSSVVPFITNSICSISFIFNRPYWDYVLFLRPIGNDYETTMMPWVLFLTHPMFRSNKKKTSTNAVSSVFVASNNTSQSRSELTTNKLFCNEIFDQNQRWSANMIRTSSGISKFLKGHYVTHIQMKSHLLH